MIREILHQLNRFRQGIRDSLLQPIRTGIPSRESLDEIAVGTPDDGSSDVIEQTDYDPTTGITSHVFMLDIDPLEASEAPLG